MPGPVPCSGAQRRGEVLDEVSTAIPGGEAVGNKRIYNKRGQLIRLEDHRRGNRNLSTTLPAIVEDVHEGYRGFRYGFDLCGNPAVARMASGNRLDIYQNTWYRHDARGNVVPHLKRFFRAGRRAGFVLMQRAGSPTDMHIDILN